jgi:uncharacterized protein YdhG (YjbR/CyaY superfamily)
MGYEQNPSWHAPDEIGAYLSILEEPVKAELNRIRRIIHEMAPEVTERVSYGIPIFRLEKDLAGLSVSTNHCSLHTMSPALMRAMKSELRGRVKISGATIQFTTVSPIPDDVLREILRRRMMEITE